MKTWITSRKSRVSRSVVVGWYVAPQCTIHMRAWRGLAFTGAYRAPSPWAGSYNNHTTFFSLHDIAPLSPLHAPKGREVLPVCGSNAVRNNSIIHLFHAFLPHSCDQFVTFFILFFLIVFCEFGLVEFFKFIFCNGTLLLFLKISSLSVGFITVVTILPSFTDTSAEGKISNWSW